MDILEKLKELLPPPPEEGPPLPRFVLRQLAKIEKAVKAGAKGWRITGGY